MFCKNCGKEVDNNAVICIGCGCAIKNEEIKAERNEQKPKEKGFIINLIAMISFFIWAIIGIKVNFENTWSFSLYTWSKYVAPWYLLRASFFFGGMLASFILLCIKDMKHAMTKYSHIIMLFVLSLCEVITYFINMTY